MSEIANLHIFCYYRVYHKITHLEITAVLALWCLITFLTIPKLTKADKRMPVWGHSKDSANFNVTLVVAFLVRFLS